MSEKYAYSSNTSGFYPVNLKSVYEESGAWPNDCVEISEDLWRDLLDGQSEGKIITVGQNGVPILKDAPSPTHDQLIQQAEIKKQRLLDNSKNIIQPLQYAVELDMATEEETFNLISWKKYQVLLSRIDTSTAPDIQWPIYPE